MSPASPQSRSTPIRRLSRASASIAPIRRAASVASRSTDVRSSPTRRSRSTQAASKARVAKAELSTGTSADVIDWRRRQLAYSGFPPLLAAGAAADERVDLHALIELAERGCPPDLAVRILAPLDAGR